MATLAKLGISDRHKYNFPISCVNDVNLTNSRRVISICIELLPLICFETVYISNLSTKKKWRSRNSWKRTARR